MLIVVALLIIVALMTVFFTQREGFAIGSGRLQLTRSRVRSDGSSEKCMIDFRSTGQYESRTPDGCAIYGEANAVAIGAFLRLSRANYLGLKPVHGSVLYTLWVGDKYIDLGTLQGLSADIVNGVRMAESLIVCSCKKPPLLDYNPYREGLFGGRSGNMDTDWETQLGFSSIYNV